MARKPTIRDVAEQGGVAISTVSRFLNGRYVSAEVRGRLKHVIKQLHYAPSPVARNLGLRRCGSIGLAVESVEDPWFGMLWAGLQEGLDRHDVTLRLDSLEDSRRRRRSLVMHWIREKQIDGVMFVRPHLRSRRLIAAALDASLPVVAVMPERPYEGTLGLHLDNALAGHTLARYLTDLGHRHLAFLGRAPQSSACTQRLNGVREGLAEVGLTLSDANVYTWGAGGDDVGTARGHEWLSRLSPVTALVAADDSLAAGVLRAALARGIAVPGCLSVVSCGGLPVGRVTVPPLTTMTPPTHDMGYTAAHWLLESIRGLKVPTDVRFTMNLVPRDSAAPTYR